MNTRPLEADADTDNADIRLLSTNEIDETSGAIGPLIAAAYGFGLFFTGTLTALAALAK